MSSHESLQRIEFSPSLQGITEEQLPGPYRSNLVSSSGILKIFSSAYSQFNEAVGQAVQNNIILLIIDDQETLASGEAQSYESNQKIQPIIKTI
ncbi:MAG: hypothetical protein JRE63_13115 [Deltaproteobacteria bacterium]|jgi:hypothetical protein|nr:hypothetical protein [Deltaproteobacteria bacterium]